MSLHNQAGELRGCIGHIEPDQFLSGRRRAVRGGGVQRRPRFPAVTPAEIAGLAIELLLLGPLEPIRGAEEIEIGRHGLVIEKGWLRGLLLPQVATEWKWDCRQFLAQTCRKAGLPLGCVEARRPNLAVRGGSVRERPHVPGSRR